MLGRLSGSMRRVPVLHELDRKNGFDLLRLLAASAVVYSHAWRIFAFGDDPTLLLFPEDDLSSFGVMTFFAISGYLVARSASRVRNGWQFARNRVLRIFPGLAACLLVTVLLIGAAATDLSLSAYFADWLTWKYLLNILLFPLQMDLPGVFLANPWSNAVNGSLWTLSVEVTAYVLIALAFVTGRGPAVVIAAMLALIFFYLLYFLMSDEYRLWYYLIEYNEKREYFFLFYMDKAGTAKLLSIFLVAALLNFLPARLFKWQFAIVLLLAVVATARTPIYVAVLVASVPYAVVTLGRLPSRLAARLHGNDLSYGIYLYHMPLLQMAWHFGHAEFAQPILLVAALILILAVAWLSWVLVERPALKFKRGGIMSLRREAVTS